ncbi:MAG: hypothetical protein KF912_00790 [Phycisphaeraceae bacterium]|nr:hypothetical protein [Phycisphaeraceae bacterium]MBX3365835.1 hypothetical protein [Phycisphaeraceae bacterium]
MLNSAVEQHNRFASSVESRLLPTIRKFEESGVKSAKAVDALPEVEVRARLIEGAGEGDVHAGLEASG